jgi:hypothetical protein
MKVRLRQRLKPDVVDDFPKMLRFRSRELQTQNDLNFLCSNRSKAKHDNLGMPRPAVMKIDMKATDLLSASVVSGINKAKELFRFTTRKERRIKKLGYPVHLMSVGQIKRHLHIFIGIFHDDDAVVINVGVPPFAALENDRAAFCSSVARK